MTYCAKCGTDNGEAVLCPSCGEPAAQPAPATEEVPAPALVVEAACVAPAAGQSVPPAPLPAPGGQPVAPVGQPLMNQHYTVQPVYNQQSPSAAQPAYNQASPYVQQAPFAPQQRSVLFIITGIALLVLGIYSAVQSIGSIISFVDIMNRIGSAYITIDMFPWANVIFNLFVDAATLITGVLALVFSKRSERSRIVTIAAATVGGLVLIQCFIFLGHHFTTLIDYGVEYYDFSTTLFGFIEGPFIVQVLITGFLLVVQLATAAVLVFASLTARRRRKQ